MVQEHAGTERDERADNDNRRKRTSAPAEQTKPSVPATPGFRQRWDAAQASKSAVFWFALAAVALAVFAGFTWGGWVTGGSSQTASTAAAQTAVIERLAPICVAQFNQDPLKDDKLVELQNASSYQRAAFVREQGWATMPGEENPDRKVSEACAQLLNGQ